MRLVSGVEGLAAGGGGVVAGLPEGFGPEDIWWSDAPHPAEVAEVPPQDEAVLVPTGRSDAADDGSVRAVAALGVADRAMAGAVAALRDARLAGGRRGGMALSSMASLLSGRTSREVRMICRAEKVLAVMAHLDAAFARGRVTWSQVRGVVTAAGPLTVAQTTVLDQELAADIDGVEVGHSEPDGLVRAAFHVAAQLACDQAEQAEADQIAHRNHLRMTLDEDGMAVAGHVDSEAGATLKAAVEAAARVSVPLCKCVVLIRRR